jgi:hypothetical protein
MTRSDPDSIASDLTPIRLLLLRPALTLLLMAVENGHFELGIDLVKAGADPNDARAFAKASADSRAEGKKVLKRSG